MNEQYVADLATQIERKTREAESVNGLTVKSVRTDRNQLIINYQSNRQANKWFCREDIYNLSELGITGASESDALSSAITERLGLGSGYCPFCGRRLEVSGE